ncbi:MAG: glycosyltransferase family 61 protein [Nitrospirales bacterium]
MNLITENFFGKMSRNRKVQALTTLAQYSPSVTQQFIPSKKPSKRSKVRAMLTHFLAYGLYPLFGAGRVGHWLGVIPYIPVSSMPNVHEEFVPPTPFDYAQFNGFPTEEFWDRPLPSQVTFNYIATISGGSADRDGFVFDETHRPISQACHPLRQRMKYRRKSWRDSITVDYRRQQPCPRHFPGRVAILTSQNQYQYSHWLFDILPRLAKLQEYHRDIDYFFLQYVHPFQLETIRSLDLIPEQSIINSEHVPWVSSDDMVVPCHQVLFGYHYPRWACDWLRQSFLPMRDIQQSSRQKIYVSRSSSGRRMITNEKEVSSFLSRQGFKICVLEQLSFAEQVSLFQRADIVVAPHGSGLANLVFCDPGTQVIELFPSRATDAYFRLSVDMGLNYRCLKTRDVVPHPRVSDNFSVDIDDLCKVLE